MLFLIRFLALLGAAFTAYTFAGIALVPESISRFELVLKPWQSTTSSILAGFYVAGSIVLMIYLIIKIVKSFGGTFRKARLSC